VHTSPKPVLRDVPSGHDLISARRTESQDQFPDLANEIISKAVVLLFLDPPEARTLVNPARVDEHVVHSIIRL
jgi:hypothetical protein